MKENEISVTFFADKNLMENFIRAKDIKAAQMGLGNLTKKQALQLAIKETIERWINEKPGF